MTLFRYRKNGLLYTLYHNKAPKCTGSWYEAHPYLHQTFIGRVVGLRPTRHGTEFTNNMSLEDFDVVAVR